METVQIMTFNCRRAMLFGYKPTKTDRTIMLRSDGVHTQLRFPGSYGWISFTSTLRHGINGCAFLPTEYTHPEYWDVVDLPVTPEQLAKMFAKAKDMVGLPDNSDKFLADMVRAGQIMYSDFNHVKYDFWRGAVFSYISKATIVKPSKTKMVCNRAVAEVVLAGLPDAMHTKHWLARNLHNEVNPANLTPSGFDGLMRNFSRMLLERIEG